MNDYEGMLVIENDLSDRSKIVDTNYWGCEQEREGLIMLSCNAGTVRAMLPAASAERMLAEVYEDHPQYAIISRGPWPEVKLDDAVQFLFESETPYPFVFTVGPTSFVGGMPGKPRPGREWKLSLWSPGPTLRLVLPARWRRVAELPDHSGWQPAAAYN